MKANEIIEIGVVAIVIIGGYEVVARLAKAKAAPPQATNTTASGGQTGNAASGALTGVATSGANHLFDWLFGSNNNSGQTNSTSGGSPTGDTYNNAGDLIGTGWGDLIGQY